MQNDAVTVAPDVHKLVFENEEFRMIDATVKPGEHAALHRHPRNITYILAGGTLRFADEAGATKDKTFHGGEVVEMPETLHAVTNIGYTELHAIQIEFKK